MAKRDAYADGMAKFKRTTLLYGVGFLLMTIAETVAGFKSELTAYLLLLILIGVACVIIGGGIGQRGLNLLKKKDRRFLLPASLGPVGLLLDGLGICIILIAIPLSFFTGYALPNSVPSGIYVPSILQAGIIVYEVFSTSNIPVLLVGVLVLTVGIICNILTSVIAIWLFGSVYKNRNLRLYAILTALPTVGLLAFLITSVEMGRIMSGRGRVGSRK